LTVFDGRPADSKQELFDGFRVQRTDAGRKDPSLDSATDSNTALWPLGIFLVSVHGLAIFMLGLSALLGERHRERATAEPYESGIVSTGSARVRFNAKFYLMAMFFVVFDLEAVFLYAYAVSFREAGWLGYIEMLIFVGVLTAALFYLWRIGALEWGTPKQKRHAKKSYQQLQPKDSRR
jgi:NADH-quinone oxidoreductase subunit A